MNFRNGRDKVVEGGEKTVTKKSCEKPNRDEKCD